MIYQYFQCTVKINMKKYNHCRITSSLLLYHIKLILIKYVHCTTIANENVAMDKVPFGMIDLLCEYLGV